MVALWVVLLGLGFFFIFFTMTELSGTYATLLSILWVGVVLWLMMEIMGDWREKRRKPTRRERDAAFWAEMDG